MSEEPMDLQHAADSTIAKASARILMPIMVAVLLVLLSVCGWLLVKVLNGVERSVGEVQKAQVETGVQVNSIDKKVSLMAQRVDTMLIRQVDQNTESLKQHEQRLERIERAVPLP